VTVNGVFYFLLAFASGALTRTIHQHERALASRANESTMLYQVSELLQSSTALDEVLERIMDIILVRLDLDRALMYLVSEDGTTLDLKLIRYHPRHRNPPPHNLRVRFNLEADEGVAPTVVREKRVFNITDPLNHPLINRDLAVRIGLNPFAIAPMLARGRVIGTIGVDRHVRGGIVSQEEARILAVAANQAGLTIQNARLYGREAQEPK
jgi:GAF domain-containing protein